MTKSPHHGKPLSTRFWSVTSNHLVGLHITQTQPSSQPQCPFTQTQLVSFLPPSLNNIKKINKEEESCDEI